MLRACPGLESAQELESGLGFTLRLLPNRAAWAPNFAIVRNTLILKGRLAQLVRAPALQADTFPESTT